MKQTQTQEHTNTHRLPHQERALMELVLRCKLLCFTALYTQAVSKGMPAVETVFKYTQSGSRSSNSPFGPDFWELSSTVGGTFKTAIFWIMQIHKLMQRQKLFFFLTNCRQWVFFLNLIYIKVSQINWPWSEQENNTVWLISPEQELIYSSLFRLLADYSQHKFMVILYPLYLSTLAV